MAKYQVMKYQPASMSEDELNNTTKRMQNEYDLTLPKSELERIFLRVMDKKPLLVRKSRSPRWRNTK